MLIRLPFSFCFNMSANVSFLKSVFIISGAGHFYFPLCFCDFTQFILHLCFSFYLPLYLYLLPLFSSCFSSSILPTSLISSVSFPWRLSTLSLQLALTECCFLFFEIQFYNYDWKWLQCASFYILCRLPYLVKTILSFHIIAARAHTHTRMSESHKSNIAII